MSDISAEAAARREQARSAGGEFGHQVRSVPTMTVEDRPLFTDDDLEALYETGSQNQIELMSVQMLAQRVKDEYPDAAFIELGTRWSDDGNYCVDRILNADGAPIADCTPYGGDQGANDWASDDLWHLSSNLRSEDGEWNRTCAYSDGDDASVVVDEAISITANDVERGEYDPNKPGRPGVPLLEPKSSTIEMSPEAVSVGDVRISPSGSSYTVDKVVQWDDMVVFTGTSSDGNPVNEAVARDELVTVARGDR